MTTFSQLVDKMVLETKRPDLATEIASYLNQTLRELHMEPSRGNAIFFRENLREEAVTANVEDSLVWEIPRPSTFQGIAAVRYDNVFADGDMVYARELVPGRAMNQTGSFYYRVGGSVVLGGYGGNNARISLAWYEFVPNLKYFATGSRPAIYDDVDGWTYADSYDTNDATRLTARELTTNWLLLRWSSVIEEGLRAKIYKRLADTERARTSYSMYMTLRQGLYTSEVADLSGSY